MNKFISSISLISLFVVNTDLLASQHDVHWTHLTEEKKPTVTPRTQEEVKTYLKGFSQFKITPKFLKAFGTKRKNFEAYTNLISSLMDSQDMKSIRLKLNKYATNAKKNLGLS